MINDIMIRICVCLCFVSELLVTCLMCLITDFYCDAAAELTLSDRMTASLTENRLWVSH